MSYPTLPFALVTYLASASADRASLRKGPIHVQVAAQKDVTVNATRFEIENDGGWAQFVETAVRLAAGEGVDTVSITYPDQGGASTDFGIILASGQEPLCFEWAYSPAFGILMAPENIAQQLRGNVGVEAVQAVLDTAAAARRLTSKSLAN